MWGAKNVLLNEEKLELSWTRNVAFHTLPNGRSVQLMFHPGGIGNPPRFEVRVDQHLVPPNVVTVACPACKAESPPADARCGQCGAAMPDGQAAYDETHVQGGTKTLFGMAAMFAFSGLAFFGVGYGESRAALDTLSQADPSTTYPLGDEMVTRDALASQVQFEMYSPLLVNLGLAAAMVGLAFWSRRAPLPALMTGAGIYAVVVVTNALISPATLGQGIIVKIIIVSFLWRAIQAALRQQKQA